MTAASHDDHLLLLPSPAGDAVLTVVDGGDHDDVGRRRWPLVTGARARELPEVLADVVRLVGPDAAATFLRVAGRAEEPVGSEPHASGPDVTVRTAFLVHEPLAVPPDELPPPASGEWAWCPLDDVGSLLPPLPEALRGTFDRWRDEQRGAPVPVERPAWATPGGIEPFLRWLDASVRATGATPTGAPEILQRWGISLVVRQATDLGSLFGKAVGSMFAVEPPITRLLAEQHPGAVPDVLALDVGRRWLLLGDARIRPFASDEAARGLRALARLQRAWVGRADELRAVGCPDRGPDTLAAELAESLGDLDLAADLAPTRGLDADQRARVRSLVPAVTALCREAAADGVPLTLLHGDCHPGNAGIREDGTVCILDWSDAAVGHPFTDVYVWLSHVPDDEQQPLRDAYLAEWPEVADGPAALRRADVLAAAYQVVTSQRLLHAVEDDERAGFAGGMSFWARQLADRYDRLDGLKAAPA